MKMRVIGECVDGGLRDWRHLASLDGLAEGIREGVELLMVVLALFDVGIGLNRSFWQSDLPGILRNPADGEIVYRGRNFSEAPGEHYEGDQPV